MLKNWPESQQPNLKFEICDFARQNLSTEASIQDEARRHEVTSLSITMEVVIATTHSKTFRIRVEGFL